MNNNHDREIMLIAGGSLSALCSGSVVLTGLMFSKTMLNRTHPFSNMIFFISLCDLLGSIAISLGYPADGTDDCRAQSFMLFFFFPASWMWTTALVYQLHSMMFYKKLKMSMFSLHCICWSISLMVALLPLSENEYGQDDDLVERSVCYLKSSHKQRKFWWLFGLYNGLLIVCVLLMIYWMVRTYWHVGTMRTTTFTDHKERAIFHATRRYPMALVVTWTLSIFVTIGLGIYNDVKVDYVQAGQIAQSQYGTLLALIFFTNSKIVRHRWKELWRRLCCFLPIASTSVDTLAMRQTEIDLDPEGDKFSSSDSMIEGPQLAEIASMLSFGRMASSASSGRLATLDTMSSSEGSQKRAESEEDVGLRVSMLIRDWIVAKVRPTLAGQDRSEGDGAGALEMRPSTATAGYSSRSHSGNSDSSAGAGTSGSRSPTGRGSRLGSFLGFAGQDSSSSSSPRSGAVRKTLAAAGSSRADGAAATVVSPLAEGLERAKLDRQQAARSPHSAATTTTTAVVAVGITAHSEDCISSKV